MRPVQHLPTRVPLHIMPAVKAKLNEVVGSDIIAIERNQLIGLAVWSLLIRKVKLVENKDGFKRSKQSTYNTKIHDRRTLPLLELKKGQGTMCSCHRQNEGVSGLGVYVKSLGYSECMWAMAHDDTLDE